MDACAGRVLVGLWFWIAGAAYAAAPLNDDISNALEVPAAGALQPLQLAGATGSASDPSCGGPVYQSVWLRYTSPVDQFVQAAAQPNSGSTAQRPRLSAWGGAPGALQPADCNPDGHEVGFMAEAGRTYWLQIYSPLPEALTAVDARVVPQAYATPPDAVPPKNNLFWYAEPMGPLPVTWTADLGAGRLDAFYDPKDCGNPNAAALGDTIWYRYTPSASGSVDVTHAVPVDLNVRVNVYTGTLDQPVWVACDRNGPYALGGARFQALAGTTYWIQFGSDFEHVGSSLQSLTIRPTPPPTGGSVVPDAKVKRRWELVFVPDIGYLPSPYLAGTVDLICDKPLPLATLLLTIRQGSRSKTLYRGFDCSTGAARLPFEFHDAQGWRPGPVTLDASAYEFDANYNVSATVTGRITP